MKAKNYSEEAIANIIRLNVLDVCTQIKLDISTKTVPKAPVDFLNKKAISQIQELLACYPPSYRFAKNSIYYDNGNRSFSCFPLRKNFIPSHIKIDTKILNHPILNKNKSYMGGKFDL
ncbi:hypothetical protein BDF14DRAFT_1761401 [Spinellus fusiger]|nr:hypothetical protein BDF14DRAFT_1761401 [Spinellus fusiger]